MLKKIAVDRARRWELVDIRDIGGVELSRTLYELVFMRAAACSATP
jgi:hypothetical protein